MSRKRHDQRDQTDHIEFYSYRTDLTRLIEKLHHVIENIPDFWAFVQKYEEVERKKSRQNVQHERGSNSGSFIFLVLIVIIVVLLFNNTVSDRK